MILAIAVAAAASVGAVCRYLFDRAVQQRHDQVFPLGTLVVNVTGSFVLGLVTGLALHHGLPSAPTAVIGAGFAGGYTTWSTYLWESVALAESGALAESAVNVLGSVVVGLGAAAAGLAVALL